MPHPTMVSLLHGGTILNSLQGTKPGKEKVFNTCFVSIQITQENMDEYLGLYRILIQHLHSVKEQSEF